MCVSVCVCVSGVCGGGGGGERTNGPEKKDMTAIT